MKLIAFDLDGTLLTRARIARPDSQAAIGRLIDLGHAVALISARPMRSVRQIAASIDPRVRLLGALNGAEAYVAPERPLLEVLDGDRAIIPDGPRLLDIPLPEGAVRKALHCARDAGIHISLYAAGAWFALGERSYGEREAGVVGYDPVWIDAPSEDILRTTHKVLLAAEADVITRQRGALARMLEAPDTDLGTPPPVVLTQSKPIYLELTHQQAGKDRALDVFAALRGIALSDTVAFGDGENDAPMLRRAGLGIAMANGVEVAQAAADMVTLDRDEAAIVHGLRWVGFDV